MVPPAMPMPMKHSSIPAGRGFLPHTSRQYLADCQAREKNGRAGQKLLAYMRRKDGKHHTRHMRPARQAVHDCTQPAGEGHRRRHAGETRQEDPRSPAEAHRAPGRTAQKRPGGRPAGLRGWFGSVDCPAHDKAHQKQVRRAALPKRHVRPAGAHGVLVAGTAPNPPKISPGRGAGGV